MSVQANSLAFYHAADLDGLCSGAILKWALASVQMVPFDYGWPFPWDLVKDRQVIMADVSLPMADMRRLRDLASPFVWIDHHKTAIDDAKQAGLSLPGLREVGQAACELTWRMYGGGLAMPRAVRLLGRYDVWDHADPEVLPFQYGARLHLKSVESPGWASLLMNDATSVKRIVRDGSLILEYEDSQNLKRVCAMAFATELDGHRAIACNVGLTNSRLFDSVYSPARHDLMMPFYRSKRGHWSVSLYSTKPEIDCGAIAKARGGGGHRGAAGFQCDELPFPLLCAREYADADAPS